MTMTPHRPFPVFSRILHWTMAVLVLAMLFIGIGMVSSVSAYHQLVAIHKPLGILVLVLVAIRLVNRLVNPPPPLPEGMPPWQRFAALGSHVLLYILMFAVPLVGWAMLSAARYPVVLYGTLQLPPIMPQNPELFAVLRETHTVLALLLFVTFLAHFGAVVFILRWRWLRCVHACGSIVARLFNGFLACQFSHWMASCCLSEWAQHCGSDCAHGFNSTRSIYFQVTGPT
jgi:cytochrome b561